MLVDSENNNSYSAIKDEYKNRIKSNLSRCSYRFSFKKHNNPYVEKARILIIDLTVEEHNINCE